MFWSLEGVWAVISELGPRRPMSSRGIAALLPLCLEAWPSRNMLLGPGFFPKNRMQGL